jgi:hypothetical protein
MDKATFKEAAVVAYLIMESAVARSTKNQVRKAIDDTLKDNEKLYKLLEEYDEKTRSKAPRTV